MVALNQSIGDSIPDFDPEEVVHSEVVEPPKVTNENSLVRRVALQVLYEIDSAQHPIGDVIDTQLRYNDLSEPGRRYLRLLVTGVQRQKEQLDSIIRRYAPEWPVDQIAIVDRNVLRLSVYELALSQDVPIKVAIDEAVELAKLYGAEGAPRFINGVLGAVADNREEITTLLKGSDGDSHSKTEADDAIT